MELLFSTIQAFQREQNILLVQNFHISKSLIVFKTLISVPNICCSHYFPWYLFKFAIIQSIGPAIIAIETVNNALFSWKYKNIVFKYICLSDIEHISIIRVLLVFFLFLIFQQWLSHKTIHYNAKRLIKIYLFTHVKFNTKW